MLPFWVIQKHCVSLSTRSRDYEAFAPNAAHSRTGSQVHRDTLDLEVDVVGNVKWVEIILNHAWIEA